MTHVHDTGGRGEHPTPPSDTSRDRISLPGASRFAARRRRHTEVLSRRATHRATPRGSWPRLPHFGAWLTLLAVLGGCTAQPVIPPSASLDDIRTVLVVPVESPPLQVIPDLIESRIPAYRHYYNMAVPLFLEETLYTYPGGILIAGLVGKDDVVTKATWPGGETSTEKTARLEPAAAWREHWTPTQVLAQEAASHLNAAGIKATASQHYYRLPMATMERNARLGNWHDAIDRWYGKETSSVDYGQSGAEPADAVLEVGIGTYKIFEGQTSLRVLVKLIDPETGRVIARTSQKAYAFEESADTLLDHEGEKFKTLVAGLGAQLVADGFSEIGLGSGRSADRAAID